MKFLAGFALTISLCALTFGQQSDTSLGRDYPKLTAAELIAKHTSSIGTSAALSAKHSRLMVGVGALTSKIYAGKISGPVEFASDGERILLAMVLNANDYPFDKIAYDRRDVTVAVLPGGVYSPLDDFVRNNKTIVKKGVFSGVLNESWALLKNDKDVKFEYAGLAKINGNRLYKLKVSLAGTGDMTVALFFDPENFRHVRTEYSYRVGQITSPNPNRPVLGPTAPSSYTLTEEFSSFAKVDDLVLPLKYNIEYASDAGKTLDWTINFSQVFNNQTLDATVFKVSE
jgi:hypothetical protein